MVNITSSQTIKSPEACYGNLSQRSRHSALSLCEASARHQWSLFLRCATASQNWNWRKTDDKNPDTPAGWGPSLWDIEVSKVMGVTPNSSKPFDHFCIETYGLGDIPLSGNLHILKSQPWNDHPGPIGQSPSAK
jgi:hypothetical protein